MEVYSHFELSLSPLLLDTSSSSWSPQPQITLSWQSEGGKIKCIVGDQALQLHQ